MGEWAATRMKSLVWEEKLVRIKAFSIRKETHGFIHEECFNTHILKSVLKHVDIQHVMSYNKIAGPLAH